MSAADYMYGMVVLFAVVVAFVCITAVMNIINGSGLPATFLESAEATTAIEKTTTMTGLLDGLFVIMFGALLIGSVVSGFLVRNHPIFFFVALLVNLVMIVVGVFMSNSLDVFVVGSPTIVTAANSYPMALWLFRYMPFLSLISMVISAAFSSHIGKEA